MTTGSPRIQRWKDNIFRVAAAVSRRITEPTASLEPKQRRRIQLLSAFLILMAINTMIGSVVMKNAGSKSWTILLATSIALLLGYIIGRTRYYRAALIIATTLPAVPPLAIAIFKLPEFDLTAELMWLAIPLMVSSMMLTVWQTIRLTLFYIALMTVLRLSGLMGFEVLALAMGYILIVTFFVITISIVRSKDQSEIENQLNERQQFEKTLRESEEKFRNLFEYAKDAIIVADAQTGIVVDANPAGCRLVGLPREKIVGMHQSGLHPPELAESYKKVFREHVEKGIVITDDIIIQRANGSQVQCDLSASVVTLADKQFIQGVFRDVSERKQMEKAVRESEEKFSKAFRASPQEICITRVKDGKTIEINESFTRFAGYTREEIIGRTSSELDIWTKPGDRQKMLKAMKENGRVHNEEYEFRIKSGEIRTQLFSAEPIVLNGEECMISIMTDITGRKRSEKLQGDEISVLTLLSQGVELNEILDAIVRLGESHDPSIKGSVMLFDPVKECLVQAAAPSLPDDYKELIKNGITIGPNMGSCGTAAYLKKRVIIPDIENSPLFPVKEVVKETIKHGLRACWSQPIMASNGEVLGTIANYSNKTGEPDSRDLRVIEWSARIAALAIERKQAEKSLRESEEKFSKAFHASPDAISISKLSDGTFLEVNDSYTHITGYAREELVGQNADKFNMWANAEQRESMLQKTREQVKMQNEEIQIRSKSGEIRTMLLSSEYVHISDELCVLVVSTDITERKQMEKALQIEKNKLQSVIDTMTDGLSIQDKDFNIIYQNEPSRVGAGGDRVGDKCYQAYEGRDNVCEGCPLELAFKDGKPHTAERRRVEPSGEITFWDNTTNPVRDAKGDIVSCLEITRNITERKKQEQALADEATRRRILIEQSSDGIVILDQNGAVYEANRRFAEMLGYSPEEILKLHVWDWDTQWTPEQLMEMIKTVDEAGDHLKTYHQRKDGTTVDVEISTNGVMFSGQKLVFCVCRDISERVRMEKALRESEEKFSKTFRSSPVCISITTLEGVFLEVNESFTRDNGYTREEVIGRSSKELGIWAQPGDRERILIKLKKNGRVEKEEYQARVKSGEIHIMLFSAEPINIAGKSCILAATVDITNRKKTEEALREREKRFSDIAGNAMEWIWEVDTKGKYIYSSPVVEKILGYKPEELLEKHFYDFFLPEEREGLRKAAFEAFAQKQPIKEFINRNRCKNGKTVELLTSGVPIINEEGNLLGYRGVDTDITERRRAEQALKESEEKFSVAFRSSPEMIIITDVENNKYLEINDSYLNVTGYSREEMMSHSVDDFQKVWVKPEELKKMTNLLQTQGNVRNEEFSFRMKSGKIRQWLCSADIVTIGGKQCMLAVSTDITEQKHAEEKLKEAMANLEQSSAQLAATNKELEAFSYSVSHDLRSPLRSIDGFSQALLEDYKEKLDETGQDYLKRLRGASQKMGELIDGILKLSRLTRSEMHREPIDLSALAQEIASRLQETQPKRRVKFAINKKLTANGDLQLMRALLENLLGNAWKFTSKNPKAKIEFSVDQNNGRKAYFIRDNGAGFDMTYADKLFGAFQRLHEVTDFPGTGIGLATVQRIIHRHGGNIWAEGAVGKGATFHFTLD